jgi:hypothetical protein
LRQWWTYPLAGAADDDAAVRGSEDFLLLRVGFEFEGFEGEFFGGGGDFERGFGEWGRAGTMSSAEAPRSDSGEQAVSGLARSKYVTPEGGLHGAYERGVRSFISLLKRASISRSKWKLRRARS